MHSLTHLSLIFCNAVDKRQGPWASCLIFQTLGRMETNTNSSALLFFVIILFYCSLHGFFHNLTKCGYVSSGPKLS